MANQDQTPTVTLACELGNCGRCKGRIFSVTEAHGSPCSHECHAEAPAGASPQLFGADPETVCPSPLVVLGYLRLAAAILEVPASPYPNRREAA
jgi:hypothetical protein